MICRKEVVVNTYTPLTTDRKFSTHAQRIRGDCALNRFVVHLALVTRSKAGLGSGNQAVSVPYVFVRLHVALQRPRLDEELIGRGKEIVTNVYVYVYIFFTSEVFSFRRHIFHLKGTRNSKNYITYSEKSILSKTVS